jgi:hypothetical protein
VFSSKITVHGSEGERSSILLIKLGLARYDEEPILWQVNRQVALSDATLVTALEFWYG